MYSLLLHLSIVSIDDDWGIEHNLHQEVTTPSRRSTAAPVDDPPTTKYPKTKTPAYIYPREKVREEKYPTEVQKENNRYKQRSSSREEDKSQDSINSREEEVKPVLNAKIRPSYREVFDDKKYFVDDEKRFIRYDDRKPSVEDKTRESRRYTSNNEKYREDGGEPKLYRKNSADRSTKYMEPEAVEYRAENAYRENLTDKQKYRESLAEKRINQIKHQERTIDRKDRYPREQSAERSTKYPGEKVNTKKYEEFDKNRYNREKSSDQIKYKPKKVDVDDEEERIQYRGGRSSGGGDSFHLNPYKQPENLPYRESVEKMMKSPIMRYKSVDDGRYPNETEWSRDNRDSRKDDRKRYSSSTDRYRELSPMGDRYREEPNPRYRDDRYQMEEIRTPVRKFIETPPESVQTMSKVSPKDRFQDAKEKFQAMDRERTRTQEKTKLVRKGSMEPTSRRGSVELPITPIHHYPAEKQNSHDGWSSDEDQPVMRTRYREPEQPPNNRYTGLERQPSQSRIAPAKSLGNLVKGYRHSYAEPQRNPLPRGSGRVGLAAVNPY